jgi:hypothetical protein
VLAVVEHDQHRPVGDVLGDGLGNVLPGRVGHAQPGRDRRPHDAGITDLRQLHPADPRREGCSGGIRGG